MQKNKIWLMLGVVLILSACGKKPAQVDPPLGTNGEYPRTYPAP